LLLSLGLAGATVRADTDTWVANTGNWNTAGDWSAGSVPSASSGVEIGNGTGGIVSVNAVVAMNNSLKIDSGYELADYTSFFIDSLFVGGVLQPASVLNNGAIVIGPTAYPITSEFSINDVTMDGTGSFDNEGAFEVERDSIANLNGAVAQHVGDVLTGGIWFFEGGPGTILVDGTATPHVFLPTKHERGGYPNQPGNRNGRGRV